MTNITISQADFNDLAWMATRYALGRKTYVVPVITQILKSHAEHLFSNNRRNMFQEIVIAIDKNEAGMEMDIAEWRKVLEVLND